MFHVIEVRRVWVQGLGFFVYRGVGRQMQAGMLCPNGTLNPNPRNPKPRNPEPGSLGQSELRTFGCFGFRV